MVQNPQVFTLLTLKCALRHNRVYFLDISTSKSGPTWCALYILTCTWASRHNGVYFLEISTSKNGPNMVCFVHFDLDMCLAPQRRALFRRLNFQKWSEHGVLCTFWLAHELRATTAFTFLEISTSKNGPNMVCFVHFDLDMCLAPQRRALFRRLNFQKWSEHGVLCTFWLANYVLRATTACTFSTSQLPKGSENGVLCTFWLGHVLRATTACAFSTSQLPKVVRTWCALYILTWTCASRYNGVQLFISQLARWLRTRRFSEVAFRPSGATNHWKNTVNRDFPTSSRTGAPASSFLLLSDSSHLCFSTSPYCRKFDF